MHRTQIYLDDDIYTFLENEKKKTHQSLSEIIRSNIKKNIKDTYNTILDKMEKAAGSWADNKESTNNYISRIRKDRKI